MSRQRWLCACASTLMSVVGIAGGISRADDFVVNTLVDENNGIGVGGVSLREAIIAADATGVDDTIRVSVTGTLTLLSDLPAIVGNVTVSGPGPTALTIDGAALHRAFAILGTPATSVTIRDLSIANCRAAGGAGGVGGGGAAGMGAALFVNAGAARVENVTFLSNAVVGGAGGGSSTNTSGGGGIGGPAPAGTSDGGSGGFLGGAGGLGAAFSPGGQGGEGAGGGGGGSGFVGITSPGSPGGPGGFGGGGGGGGMGGFDFVTFTAGPGGAGSAGGFGGGGGGGGSGSSVGAAGAGGMFGGNAFSGFPGGGAGLGGAVFARAGTLTLVNCTFKNNSAGGGAAGGVGATAGLGKGGAIFLNSGVTGAERGTIFGTAGEVNSATDDAATAVDNDNLLGVLSPIPIVASVTRLSPSPTAAATVAYAVVFSEAVTGVGTSDFVVTTTGLSGAGVASVSGSGASYTVTVNPGSGEGTLRLDVADDDSVVNAGGVPLGSLGAGNGAFTAGEVYTVDTTPPTAADITPSTTGPTDATSVSFSVTFSEAVTGFADATDVTLNEAGVSHGSVSITAVDAAHYTVTVDGIAGDGTLSLSVNAGAAQDAVGNASTAGGPSAVVTFSHGTPGGGGDGGGSSPGGCGAGLCGVGSGASIGLTMLGLMQIRRGIGRRRRRR